VAFLPAICLAILVGESLRRLHQIFEQITPVVITVLGQEIARIDFLEILRLSAIAQATARLVENYPTTFFTLVVVLALAGGLVLLIAGLLFTLGYNWLSSRGWGLTIELDEKP
jgi:hypothetical protein